MARYRDNRELWYLPITNSHDSIELSHVLRPELGLLFRNSSREGNGSGLDLVDTTGDFIMGGGHLGLEVVVVRGHGDGEYLSGAAEERNTVTSVTRQITQSATVVLELRSADREAARVIETSYTKRHAARSGAHRVTLGLTAGLPGIPHPQISAVTPVRGHVGSAFQGFGQATGTLASLGSPMQLVR